jgi:hypothetical protein
LETSDRVSYGGAAEILIENKRYFDTKKESLIEALKSSSVLDSSFFQKSKV